MKGAPEVEGSPPETSAGIRLERRGSSNFTVSVCRVSLNHQTSHERLVNYRFRFSCCTGGEKKKGFYCAFHASMAVNAPLTHQHASLEQLSSDPPPPSPPFYLYTMSRLPPPPRFACCWYSRYCKSSFRAGQRRWEV